MTGFKVVEYKDFAKRTIRLVQAKFESGSVFSDTLLTALVMAGVDLESPTPLEIRIDVFLGYQDNRQAILFGVSKIPAGTVIATSYELNNFTNSINSVEVKFAGTNGWYEISTSGGKTTVYPFDRRRESA